MDDAVTDRLVQLAPEYYRGEMLCPRCGDNGRGEVYVICADKAGYSHEESCAKYHYGDLCPRCDAEVEAELAVEARQSERTPNA